MKKGTTGFLSILSCLALPCQAAGGDVFQLPLEDLLQLEVAGATRTYEVLETVPSPVTLFTRANIRGLGADTLAELLDYSPGFQVHRNADASAYELVSSRARRVGNTNAEIVVLIDGVRVADPRTNGASPALSVPLDNVERVEVIRGPGSAQYGSGAITGVINVVTARGDRSLSAEGGQWGHRAVSALYGDEQGTFHFDIYAHYQRDDGDRLPVSPTYDFADREVRDPQGRSYVSLNLGTATTRFTVNHINQSAEDAYLAGIVQPGYVNRDYDQTQAALAHSFRSRRGDHQLSLVYAKSSNSFNTILAAPGELQPISMPSSSEPFLSSADFSNYSWRGEWLATFNTRFGVTAQYGAEFERRVSDPVWTVNNYNLGELISGNFPVTHYDEPTRDTLIQQSGDQEVVAAFGQVIYDLRKKTRITFGGRYDHYPDSDQSEFSPRVAVVHSLNHNHRLKLIYAEAFRAPGLQETLTVNNPVSLGNPDLKPEKVRNWELIWVGSLSSSVMQVGLFDSRYRDSIVNEVVPGTGVRQFANVTDEHYRGVEFELNYEVSDKCSFNLAYTNVFDVPDSAFRESQSFGSATLLHEFSNFASQLSVRYRGERETPQANGERKALDAYTVVNLRLSWQFDPDVSLYVDIKNAADEQVFFASQRPLPQEGVPLRGRHVSAGLRWQFGRH